MSNFARYASINQEQTAQYHLNKLSLESNFLSDIIGTFREGLPVFIKDLTQSKATLYAEFESNGVDLRNVTKEQKRILNIIRTLPYGAISDKLVTVPQNFNGDLVAYLELLEGMTSSVYKLANETLGDYNAYIAAFISNREVQKTLENHQVFLVRVQRARESFIKQISAFFPHNTGATRTRLIKIIPRSNDVNNLLAILVKLENSYKQVNLHAIKDALDKSVSMLDILIEQINKEEITSISPNAAQNIAAGASEVGKFVEFVSVFYFNTKVAITTVNDVFRIITDTENQ